MLQPLCPVLSIADSVHQIYCQVDKCAWWDKDKNQCCVLTLSQKQYPIMQFTLPS